MLPTWLLVGLGGALGSISRYYASSLLLNLTGKHFPYGTLFVNVAGCFLMGLLAIFLDSQFKEHLSELRLFAAVGILGGFTTFSAFSLESLQLWQSSHYGIAFINIILNLAICLLSVWLGQLVGKHLF
jgi:CrcB protein